MTATRPNLTDRALRYRANQTIPEHAKVCAFCGGKQVEVGHVDGHEENGAPDNLTWTCRPCNVIASNTLRKAGIGRKTVQFNPTKSGGAQSVGEWMQAVGAITPRIDRGERGLASSMSVPDAVAMIRATPHHKRSEFASELRKHVAARRRSNPGLFAPGGLLGSRDYTYDLGKRRKESAAEQKRQASEAKRREQERKAAEKKREKEQRDAERAEDRRIKLEERAEKKRQPKLVGFYRGFRMYRTADGEYYSSLDADSWYPSLATTKRSVDDWKAGRSNPNGKKKRGPLAKGLATGLDIYDAAWDYTGGLPSKLLRKYSGNPNSHDLIREAETSRNAEELARLYKYATRKSDHELRAAVEARAAQLRIPHSELTKERGWNPKRNPEAAADKLYERFHGREPEESVDIHEDLHEHEYLGTLGDLTEIYVDTLTGLRLHLTWEGRDDLPFLAATEDGKQLYIKGGKQALDLKSIKMDGPEWVKDRMVIGQFSAPDPCSKCGGTFKYSEARNVHVCTICRHVADDDDRVHNITYRTEKDFDNFEQIDYQHDLGEVSGVRPMLEYEPRNERLYVTGGQYHIELPVFETSPGIEN